MSRRRVLRPWRLHRAVVFAVTLAAAFALMTLPADAATRCADPARVGEVKVATIPVVPRLELTVDGKKVVLGKKGTGTVTACRLDLTDRIDVPDAELQIDERRQVRYDRMFVTSSGSLVTLAFHVDYLTDVQLHGLPPEQIDSYTLRSSTGQRLEELAQEPAWLWGSRVIRGASGLQLRDIYYTVDTVMARGSSVVNKSQVKFYPREQPEVDVDLLTYRVKLEVRDRLFGFRVGTAAHLTAVDGTVQNEPLTNGDALLRGVPRGAYVVTVDAPALSVSRPVSISKDQIVDLPVLTYVDIGVLLGMPTLLAIGLILAPRPKLRAQLSPRRLVAVVARKAGRPVRERTRAPRHRAGAHRQHLVARLRSTRRAMAAGEAARRQPAVRRVRAGAVRASAFVNAAKHKFAGSRAAIRRGPDPGRGMDREPASVSEPPQHNDAVLEQGSRVTQGGVLHE